MGVRWASRELELRVSTGNNALTCLEVELETES
jgi:hypothetical protein